MSAWLSKLEGMDRGEDGLSPYQCFQLGPGITSLAGLGQFQQVFGIFGGLLQPPKKMKLLAGVGVDLLLELHGHCPRSLGTHQWQIEES